MVTPEVLFDDYEWYRHKTSYYKARLQQAGSLSRIRRDPERLAKLQALIDWCNEHAFDPRYYLAGLFHNLKWNFAPKWEHLVPASRKTEAKAKTRYQALGSIPQYTQRLHETRRQEVRETLYDPRRDTSPSVENIKRRYLNDMQPERCMSDMNVRTLGFHPRSIVCARCPLAQQCKQTLEASVNYDIVALRRGELTLDQAQRIAGWRNHHGSC